VEYGLRNDLSYCVVDGHAVFLDVAADKYFELPEQLDKAFVGYASASDRSRAPESMLVERNILVPGGRVFGDASRPAASTPSRSALETPEVHSRYAIQALPEVMMTTWRCRHRLVSRSLRDVIDETSRYRARHCPAPPTSPTAAQERQLLRLVDVFHRARRYVPIEPRCLLDSLSLCRFLARRHLTSRIVLGVTNDPFAAHCWVQAGDIVLSDTVGNAMAHTIIKVI
jgi:hypothetical protein